MNTKRLRHPLFLLSMALLLAGAVTVTITDFAILGWVLLILGLVLNFIAAGRSEETGDRR